MKPKKLSESELNVFNKHIASCKFIEVVTLLATLAKRGRRNRIGRREKWPKKSWEEGEKEKLGVGRIELDGPGRGNKK